jgi:hypothetical protein
MVQDVVVVQFLSRAKHMAHLPSSVIRDWSCGGRVERKVWWRHTRINFSHHHSANLRLLTWNLREAPAL